MFFINIESRSVINKQNVISWTVDFTQRECEMLVDTQNCGRKSGLDVITRFASSDTYVIHVLRSKISENFF